MPWTLLVYVPLLLGDCWGQSGSLLGRGVGVRGSPFGRSPCSAGHESSSVPLTPTVGSKMIVVLSFLSVLGE